MVRALLLSLWFVLTPCGGQEIRSCGAGTWYDAIADACTCQADCSATSNTTLGTVNDTQTIHIAGILDTGNFHWAEELFNITISLLNNRSDGFHDDIFPNDPTTQIAYELANDDCDETAATRAYWQLRRTFGGVPIHGIVGSRCSGPSIALARIAGLEHVAQVSPVSASAQLADDDEFPYFSRLVSPSDHRGAVGAIIAMLRSFGWSRVSLIATDTQYAKDSANEFRKHWSGEHYDYETGALLWTGKVAYSNTVSLLPSGEIDEESARQVLLGVPIDDPTVNSRVIVLISQEEQGFPILKLANDMGFQDDTIWTGIAWIARNSPIGTDWLSGTDFPGYMGIAPFRNHDDVAQDFVRRVQEIQVSQGREPWEGLYYYAMEYVVDSILTLVTAISRVPTDQRRNGTAITEAIRSITMNGVSGPVSFTENGDRADPLFSMYNFQKLPNGTFDWIEIGTTGVIVSTTEFFGDPRTLCFAKVGCQVDAIPSDTYDIPKPKTPTWVFVVIPLILVVLLGLAFKYWRKSVNHKATMDSLTAMQERMGELENINNKLTDLDREVECATRKKDELILRRGSLIDKPHTWTNSRQTLIEVTPNDDQYWTVLHQLQGTMKNAHIAKLWRIQNSSLWSYYSFHKHRLRKENIEINESAAWHGTSSLDPSVVYDDRQDGFMMQYSEKGFWGRGIYFAEKSKYSHEYAFKPSQLSPTSVKKVGRPVGLDDEREIFLAKLLVGESIEMDRDANVVRKMECAALTVPPVNRTTKLKYNTVTGVTGDSRVWVVYENGRAYPEYLVRYYDGKRDPKRTPFKSQKEAQRSHHRQPLTSSTETISVCSDEPTITKSVEANDRPNASPTLPPQTICTEGHALVEENAQPDSTAVLYDNLESGTTGWRSQTRFIWEHWIIASSQWEEYDPFQQTTLEVAYQEFLVSEKHAIVRVDNNSDGEFQEVNFVTMQQVDQHHPDQTKTSIRRRPENLGALR